MSYIHQATRRKFITIIDEWNMLIHDETAHLSIQEEYINLLRGLFKVSYLTEFLHLVFLTGILPIKKIKTQSTLNNFDEFTMIEPDMLAPYIGFAGNEVKVLCKDYHQDFEKVKCWYNGYLLNGYKVYNPKAVVSLMLRGKFRSYWSKTGTYESILPLINMNFDGLKEAIIAMLSGVYIKVETIIRVAFKNKDDIFMVLIHFGYLTYNQIDSKVFIPNEDIRTEFKDAYRRNRIE